MPANANMSKAVACANMRRRGAAPAQAHRHDQGDKKLGGYVPADCGAASSPGMCPRGVYGKLRRRLSPYNPHCLSRTDVACLDCGGRGARSPFQAVTNARAH
ncbi:hypothetical protein BC628DRAFT_797931 [Trametes gibbosa]|nr:hypothetical protein BC628DRAFT_797931 [Trametes gibbosa]